MTDNSNPTARALWLALSASPSRVLNTEPAAIRALLVWNDRGNVAPDEYGSDTDCAYTLLCSFAADVPAGNDPAGHTLLSLFDKAQAEFATLGYGGTYTDPGARCEELAALLDPARSAEACDMIADWRDRCGLPEELADALHDAVETNYHIMTRG